MVFVAEYPDMMRNSMIVNSSLEPTLVNFLEQLQTFIKNDPATIIHEIVDRINKKRKDVAPAWRQRSDVFLSYSRSDADVAQRVKKTLQAMGSPCGLTKIPYLRVPTGEPR